MKLPFLFFAVFVGIFTWGPAARAQSKPASGTPTEASAKLSYTVFHVPTNAVALTFNDGPHPKNTPKLLDILKEKGVKATFFCLGKNVLSFPDIAKRIVAEGHEIGNVPWSHVGLSKMSEAKMLEDLQKTHDAILTTCGVAPRVYRPPFGAVKTAQEKVIMEHFHYPTIQWEVDSRDWQAPRTAAKVHDIIMKETHAGSIILCGDIHENTVEAMPGVIEELKLHGFEFKTISEMIQLEADSAKAPAPKPATAAAPPASTPAPAPATPAKTKP